MESKFDLVLHSGSAYIGSRKNLSCETVDIGVKNQKIVKIGKIKSTEAHASLDASGLHILPGLIDTQVHFREPGLTHKEDIHHGSRGAAQGGITGFFEMPNTTPSTTDVERIKEKISIAKKTSLVDFAFYAGATDSNIEDLKAMTKVKGCCGVKIFMGSSTGQLLVDQIQSIENILRELPCNIAVHCENEERLKARKHLVLDNPGKVELHPVWRDDETAQTASHALVEVAKKLKRKVHVLHVTTWQEMEYLKANKDWCTVEVTPQHLTLTAPECYEKLGTLAQMNPPIRNKKHQQALWQAVTDRVVDIIGSDHAPHTLAEKHQQYPNTPSGMTGVQTTVPLMLNHVHEGRLSLEHMLDLLKFNPCEIFQINNKGGIVEGFDADFTVVDLKRTQTISNDWIESKSQWTPFAGKQVTGWPIATIVRGQIVMQNGQINNSCRGNEIETS